MSFVVDRNLPFASASPEDRQGNADGLAVDLGAPSTRRVMMTVGEIGNVIGSLPSPSAEVRVETSADGSSWSAVKSFRALRVGTEQTEPLAFLRYARAAHTFAAGAGARFNIILSQPTQ